MSLIGRELERLAASPVAEERAREFFRKGLFVAILLTVWISTKPFYTTSAESGPPASDIVNQVTFSGLGALCLSALLFVDRRALAPLLQPSYALMFAWLVVVTVTSTQPDISQRAFAFTTVVMFLAAMLFALPQRFLDFENLLLGSALAIMGLAYASIVIVPDLAMHTDFDPFEPEHAGSWKGHFNHKNLAGAMMGVFAAIGIYAWRVGRLRIGLALLVGGVAFLYFTKSKTSLGLFPLVVMACLLAEHLGSRTLRFAVLLGPIVLMMVLTLGGVLAEPIAAFNKLVMKDPSFTGRFDIWRYGFEKLAERPIGGYGFEGFWQTSTTLQGESKLELAWSVEKIIHGHSGYLDVALTQGLIGLTLTAFVFLVKPVVDYNRATGSGDNRALATMFLMIWMFISLGQCLEVYYFRRADPVWFALLVAVFGLRFTAALRIDRSPSPAAPSS
jgi:O-antigen ligase